MACYKLTSCTASNNTVIYTNTNLLAFVGTNIKISSDPSVCFSVEVSDPPCTCTSPVNVTVTSENCTCSTTYLCYLLTECNNFIPPFYTSTNLNPYVGTSISINEQPGYCFNVAGITNGTECELATKLPVTCAVSCNCGPPIYTYTLTNCLNPAQIITVNTTLVLTINSVIAPTPSIIFSGGNNCWTVTATTTGIGTTITSVVNYGVNGCVACAAPPPCYQLTSCDGQTTVYTQTNLSSFLGMVITIPSLPNTCWFVANSPLVCTNPISINPETIILNCNCPCYSLRNCVTQEVIRTNSNLSSFVGQSVHLNEFGGCGGNCWLVSLNQGPCTTPQFVTVTVGCTSCPPCDQTCYELVDCLTDVVFTKLINPTVNNVNLSTLVGGQTVGQITIGSTTTNGCWYVRLSQNCTGAVTGSVTNIYPSCDDCTNSCYGLLNCTTLEVDYVIKYTTPNPNGLPNPNTLSGSIGSLCFEGLTGCVTGCYQFQLISGVSCVGSVNWSTVVSYTPYTTCSDCLPACYLLTECAPAVSNPIVVNNDLSLYVGSVAKICDDQGICRCYNVEIAQSCNGSITIDNANASFTTCEECNSCGCPPGYTKIGNNCQKITTVPAIRNPIIYSTQQGSIDNFYGNLGTNFYSNISALPFPLTSVISPDRFQDASAVNVPFVNNTTGVWGGPVGSRLNTIGIWSNLAPNPINEWVGFVECVNIPTSKTYCIGIGGDDNVRIKIDGVLVVIANIGPFDFNYWHVFEINLTAGTHILTIEGYNTGGPAAFGAEIYNTTSAILQTFTTVTQVQTATIFTTFNNRKDGTFETGESSGYSCSPGYTLNTCGISPVCSLVETVPFVECSPTFLVTDCSGEQEPYYTNTNLSSYINDTYKTCIPTITYSTNCFLLKDCNRLSPDIVTNTVLTARLWQTISIEGYPGSCFIVTGIPTGQPCTGAVPVVVIGNVSCTCEGAQTPWPAGCYCVTVEKVVPDIIASDFTGVFNITSYNSCIECTKICYLLTSCIGGITSVIVHNDLSEYVGKVIKIDSCGDICWQVSISPNCNGSISFAGDITMFNNCTACLPPIPPTPAPFDLHLRKIKPGWKSPNTCYSLEHIEKINCNFGQQIYNKMLVSKYGVTMCSEEDITKWDILKQMLDLDMLKDPNMCKSTLCYCPAPCFIDAVITILPFCGSPNIVSTSITVPCIAPVFVNAEIEILRVSATCNCFSVEVLNQPVTIIYKDCCCITQTQVLETLGIHAICSTTTPFAPISPSSIIVTNTGLCGTASLCNPPPPQICSCWEISNIGSSVGEYSISAVCPPTGPFDFGLSGYIEVGAPSVYVCSVATPNIDSNLSVVNTGPCDGYCGAIPPVCVCYKIVLDELALNCSFNYTDCNGVLVVDHVPTTLTSYICSQTLPISNDCGLVFPPSFTITATSFDCVDGQCGPCDCYLYNVAPSPGVQIQNYTNCLGQNTSLVVTPGATGYICVRNFGEVINPNIVTTLMPPGTPGCTLIGC